jgi:hypothetical protein
MKRGSDAILEGREVLANFATNCTLGWIFGKTGEKLEDEFDKDLGGEAEEGGCSGLRWYSSSSIARSRSSGMGEREVWEEGLEVGESAPVSSVCAFRE